MRHVGPTLRKKGGLLLGGVWPHLSSHGSLTTREAEAERSLESNEGGYKGALNYSDFTPTRGEK